MHWIFSVYFVWETIHVNVLVPNSHILCFLELSIYTVYILYGLNAFDYFTFRLNDTHPLSLRQIVELVEAVTPARWRDEVIREQDFNFRLWWTPGESSSYLLKNLRNATPCRRRGRTWPNVPSLSLAAPVIRQWKRHE